MTPLNKKGEKKPVRIQRKRTKGWKMPKNTIYVGRPTKWGNPYLLKDYGHDGLGRYLVGDKYKSRIISVVIKVENGKAIFLADIAKIELKGKNLACWCPIRDKNGNKIYCHADILLQIANS